MTTQAERLFGDEVELGVVADDSGQITVIEGASHLGFDIKRVYFLHSLTPFALRGGHAHRALYQLMIPINGSFTLTLTNGGRTKVIEVNNPAVGIFVPPLTWRILQNFSPGAACLVLASAEYDEGDYIRSQEEFDNLTL